MLNLDFALQTSVYEATEYFYTMMGKIFIRQSDAIVPFREHTHNPEGGNCYYYSSWALLGLKGSDLLVRGQINLPQYGKYKAQSNYVHGWCQFEYEGDYFVYDPLKSHVIPLSVYEDIYQPHNITFQKTQREILQIFLQEPYAYQIEDIFQLKSARDLPKQYTSEKNGWLSDTLKSVQIHYAYDKVYTALVTARSTSW